MNEDCRERNEKHLGPSLNRFYVVLMVIAVFFGIFLATRVLAKPKDKSEPCVIRLDSKSVARVAIAVDGTVLGFPVKPTDVILGNKGSFGINYVKSDLAISPMSSASRSNLFVYLEGRRFSFSLTTTSLNQCPVLSIRDSEESRMRVEK